MPVIWKMLESFDRLEIGVYNAGGYCRGTDYLPPARPQPAGRVFFGLGLSPERWYQLAAPSDGRRRGSDLIDPLHPLGRSAGCRRPGRVHLGLLRGADGRRHRIDLRGAGTILRSGYRKVPDHPGPTGEGQSLRPLGCKRRRGDCRAAGADGSGCQEEEGLED